MSALSSLSESPSLPHDAETPKHHRASKFLHPLSSNSAMHCRCSLTSPSPLCLPTRHGESDWNEVFNRGFGPSFPMRLLMAILRELRLAETPDSVFIDSGLSPLGMQQARELMTFLEGSADPTDNAGMHALLRGDGRAQEDSVVMSSNLRRALATAAIGLQRRLHLTGERVLIVSDLQVCNAPPPLPFTRTLSWHANPPFLLSVQDSTSFPFGSLAALSKSSPVLPVLAPNPSAVSPDSLHWPSLTFSGYVFIPLNPGCPPAG